MQSVPADEGFWVTADGGDRVWVQIETTGESPFVVEPGTRVSFTGTVVVTKITVFVIMVIVLMIKPAGLFGRER